jgi:hypothetical protein
MKAPFTSLCAVAAVVFLAGWSGYAQQSSAKDKWEYLIVHGQVSHFLTDQRLNELGAQGWELVSVTFGCVGDASCYTSAYLKRAK